MGDNMSETLKRLKADFERVKKLCASDFSCAADFARRDRLARRIAEVDGRKKSSRDREQTK